MSFLTDYLSLALMPFNPAYATSRLLSNTQTDVPEDTSSNTNVSPVNEDRVNYRTWENNTGEVRAPLVTGNTVSEGLKRGNHTVYDGFDPAKLAYEIKQGQHGNGTNRIQRLTQLGYTPEQIKAAQDLINQSMKRGTVPTALIKRSIAPTVTDAIRYNRNDFIPNNSNATTNTVSTGYATGHEARFNPVTGRLEFI